jgi:hypothetical protein
MKSDRNCLLVLLGEFEKLRKETISFVIFRKFFEKIKVSLKSDKNNGYFTWRLMHIYDMSLNSYYNEKCFRQEL